MSLYVENATRKTSLGSRIRIADSPWQRIVGLLGTSKLEADDGLLIFPTQAVHTIGMKYPIDLIFLDRKQCAVGLRNSVVPNRFSRIYWRAQCVIELPEGTIERTGTQLGDKIEWWDVELSKP